MSASAPYFTAGLSSKEAADLVEKMAVPMRSDRGGMISCAEALARGGDEALVSFSEDCHLESCTPTLQSGSLILWAGMGEQPPRKKGKVSCPCSLMQPLR